MEAVHLHRDRLNIHEKICPSDRVRIFLQTKNLQLMTVLQSSSKIRIHLRSDDIEEIREH